MPFSQFSGCVDPLTKIAQYACSHAPNSILFELDGGDAGTQLVPWRLLALVILRCHQEGQRNFEGGVDLARTDPKCEAFADAREGRHNAVATRRYVHVKIADRFHEAAVERDLLLGLAQRGFCRGRVINFHLATRKRYLACMVREMTGTPRE